MLTTIKGYYEEGRIVLSEDAPVYSKTDVMVTFLTGPDENKPNKRVPGSLKGKVELPDDFNEPLDDLKDYM
ncbi:DUF2281 domain-containing protein [Mucilaginibacter glaciei]|uniref:DUF2281 domain-containing protein n=1 Tax=Mucilaginibacter glaciei TaxID=2772109 RepID=A0A926NX98_9SPHI|nr:DUF2281 domain-containing protein [Mucilaginibacter glaciei]MBD1393523.1 DUF2281 domain-containing protein [Mucilaginibacter glaciei]